MTAKKSTTVKKIDSSSELYIGGWTFESDEGQSDAELVEEFDSGGFDNSFTGTKQEVERQIADDIGIGIPRGSGGKIVILLAKVELQRYTATVKTSVSLSKRT